jgi:splicing factor 3B subunit 1
MYMLVGNQIDGAATPGWAPGETPAVGATPAKKGRSRWDETPAGVSATFGATPMIAAGATPFGLTPGMTPMGAMDMATPSPSMLNKVPLTAEEYQVLAHLMSCLNLP